MLFAGGSGADPAWDPAIPGRSTTMTRNRLYFILMGGCVTAVILAWTVVRIFSVTAAVVISVAVGLVPPIAAIVANAGDESSRRL
jgi:Protein of unknown function (DUF3099)